MGPGSLGLGVPFVLTLLLAAFIVLGFVTLVMRIRREARHHDPMRDESSWGDQ